MAVGRRSVRAILIDGLDQLMLIKRTKPGQAPYWTAPGGGVEDTDASMEAALRRELAEELGAETAGVSQVFLVSSPSDAGVAVQHFFVARLVRAGPVRPSGRRLAGDRPQADRLKGIHPGESGGVACRGSAGHLIFGRRISARNWSSIAPTVLVEPGQPRAASGATQ